MKHPTTAATRKLSAGGVVQQGGLPARVPPMIRKSIALLAMILVGVAVYCAVAAVATTPAEARAAAKKAFEAGNFKDAYDAFSRLAVDAHDDPMLVGDDLTFAVQSLQRLGRVDEVDDFRESVISAHPQNWRLLWKAAETFRSTEGYGFIVAGKFYRGPRHGNDGRLVNATERDRVRALQLMRQAMKIVSGPQDHLENSQDVAPFYFAFADFLLDNRMGDGAWRLQFLSDLSKLPDYEEGYGYWSGEARGAPVDEAGKPVYHHLPKSWEAATTDGERWRWCLAEAARVSPAAAPRADFIFAQFLQNQFDVQTMAQAGYTFFGRGGAAEEDTKKDESGPYAVASLKEDETIARLANGIKRFALPDEFNFIRLLQDVADKDKGTYGEQALNLLGTLFENRQQYDRAVEFWKQDIARYGPGDNAWRQLRVDQILNNWGVFEQTRTQPAGTDAIVSFLFRNGKRVHFDAWELDEQKLLADVKAVLKSNPKQLNWEEIGIDNIGWRLVEKNQNQYRGKQVASWDLDLTPREKHFDRRIIVKTPLKKGGAYLLTATMQGGNTNSVVLWVADTVLVKKTLSDGTYCFIADAVSGQPIPKSKVSLFGWQQKWLGDRNYQVNTREMEKGADADGQAIIPSQNEDNQYQWVITATAPDGRFAYYGFTGLWGGQYAYDAQYNQRKDFLITDRPVYRPGQTAKFKFWVGQAQYDQKGPSPFANRPFTVEIRNPKNEKVFEKTFTADGFGGFDGEFPIDSGATLGAYLIRLSDGGGGSFRVEEYKKPEFEVKIDAPAEPVSLGEKVTATISAKYYFGAPVTQAKVKYKVVRSSHSAQWYPPGRWDWFYGPGYWWFAEDYNWYPGWDKWGCLRPRAWWFGASWERPEVVSENELPIGPDGMVKIEIDTALAKAIHGDTDHEYDITAEVTDDSRRTIVGQG